jgi:hypothetical protein
MCAWGNSVTLQEVRKPRRGAIPFDGSIFPGVIPAGDRDRACVAAERGTIWTRSDIDAIASGARQCPTAQRRLCNSDARNITATSRAEPKKL